MKITVVKRMISFVLAVLLVCSAVPIVFAVESEEIDDSPFESLIIEDMNIIEFTGGTDWGTYYSYDFHKIKYKVVLKNGKVLDSNGSSIYYNGNQYYISVTSDQSAKKPWVAGNKYEVTGSVLGLTAEFKVAILESPIANIIITQDLILGIDVDISNGEAGYMLENFPIRVEYKDGTSVDVEGISGIIYDGERYDYGISGNIGLSEWTGPGKYTVPIKVLGFSQDVEINIVENPYSSLEIEYINKEFSIVFTNINGEKKTEGVIGFDVRAGGRGLLMGLLFTNERVYETASFTFSYSYNPHIEHYSTNVKLKIGNMTSNVVNRFEWLEVNQLAPISFLCAIRWKTIGSIPFCGYVKDNEYDVDSIISIACEINGESNNDDEKWIFDGGLKCKYLGIQEITKAVEKVFGITDIDITKSKHYDNNAPEDLLVEFLCGYNELFEPRKIRYEDGLWIIENSQIILTVTDEMVIERIEYPSSFIKGDFDGDGEITVADALSALRIAVRIVPLDATSVVIGDFDGDGTVTVSDALAILRKAAGFV